MCSDITPADGLKITQEAKRWKGTEYKKVGDQSDITKGGDCSGTTWRIYTNAGFPYEYRNTATFAAYAEKEQKFRELDAADPRQEGDILLWSDHMAIYCTFASDVENSFTDRVNPKTQKHWSQKNDMWTATKPGGLPYEPAKAEYFKPTAPRVFRYQK